MQPMSPPRLTVVLPTRNRQADLLRAARSVLSQTYRDLELIVVDEGSSDDTPDVLVSLCNEDPRVRFVRNDVAVGLPGARNCGIDAARGDLVAFCDDDDAWLPDAAHYLVEVFDRDPEVGAVSSWHQVLRVESGRAVIYRAPLDLDEHLLLWMNFVGTPFAMYRRSSFGPEHRFDTGLAKMTEDWDFWLRCAQQRPFRMVPRVLYLYRQHDGPRITQDPTRHSDGLLEFVAKHHDAMTPACRAYHRCVADLLLGRRGSVARRLAEVARSSPADAAFVSLVLGASWEASALGPRLRDPALTGRTMARLLRSPWAR
jgi:glycosyltransferase involved in cell wall biosynthesis